ncbi:DUF2281 domain-containing protein [Dyadobacter sp. CY312]|uniref:DUF2281 domain-containing protein n=1 Tax=Dyadobacter sp. CY312 TaxID=2907303 RepID=UPI001F446057|nr:DUF2281 domain-containing protein [Dyadobacter sp. CY312]MCE7042170.1 DUF2281 domain-containing protein [Dyadobacter sp. CY312]
MTDEDLNNKISQLPEHLRETVSDFVDFLIYKHREKFNDFEDTLDLIDARIIEERKSEDSIPFDEFVKQLKDEGKLDD